MTPPGKRRKAVRSSAVSSGLRGVMRLSGAIGWNPLYSKASGPARACACVRTGQRDGWTPGPGPATVRRAATAMDISERVNRAVTWGLSCLVVVPAFTVLMRLFNRTRIVGKHHLQRAPLPLLLVSDHVTILEHGV